MKDREKEIKKSMYDKSMQIRELKQELRQLRKELNRLNTSKTRSRKLERGKRRIVTSI